MTSGNEGEIDEGAATFEEGIAGVASSVGSAVDTLENATYSLGKTLNIAGYNIEGTSGLVGNTYNFNIWALYATEDSQGLFALSNAMQEQAAAAGATQINVTGLAIINQSLLNPSTAARLGFTFVGSNGSSAAWTATVGNP